MRHTPSIQTTALIAALASIYPLQVYANAGVTQFSIGDVSVQRAAGNTPLSSGNRIDSGDLITTGNTGRTQLRFTDGGMVSLQPNSQFKISSYSDAAPGKQDSFLVDLARGGMRALTGLIGKRNRENYKVVTSTATVGIRGSGFSMAYNPDGTLGVTTEQDAIEVCTQAGCIGLNLGESALVTNAQSLPSRTRERASWNPPNPRRLITARNDDTNSEGKISTIRVATGLALTSAGLGEGAGLGEEGGNVRLYLDGAAAGNAENGALLGYAANTSAGDVGKSGQISVVNRDGSLANGDLIILGAWQGAQWSGSQPGTLSQSAFVMGVPTPQATLNATSGVQARYDLSHATSVFSSNTLNRGTLLPSSHILVDFGNAERQLDVNLDVTMARLNNEMPGNTSPPPTQYNYSGQASSSNAGFYGELTLNNGESYTAGEFKGFFSGRAAGKIGLSFRAYTPSEEQIAGAGVFARTAVPPPPPPPNMALTSTGLLEEGSSSPFLYLNGVDSRSTNGNLLSYLASNGDQAQNGTTTELARSGSTTTNDLMILGSWANVEWSVANASGFEKSAFVIGQPTSSQALIDFNNVRGQYNLTAGTPVYNNFGSNGTGTLLSTSKVIVDFRSAFGAMDINLDLDLPNNYEESANTSSNNIAYNLRGSATASNAGFSGTLGASSYGYLVGKGKVSGFFGGTQAGTLGLSYSADINFQGSIAGAGIFAREGTVAVPSTSVNNYSDSKHSLYFADGSGYFLPNAADNAFYIGEGQSADFSGTRLTSWAGNGPSNTTGMQSSGAMQSYGAVGQPTESNFIGWGSWEQGTRTAGSYSNSNSSMLNAVHYVVGKPTSVMPFSGSASYNLIGNSTPTATLANNTTAGQLTSASLNVTFGTTGSATASFVTRFNNTDVPFSATANLNGSNFRSSSEVNTSISGLFTGNDAQRAGLVYRHTDSTFGNITGAAAFQRIGGGIQIPVQ